MADIRLKDSFRRNKKILRLEKALHEAGVLALVQLWCQVAEERPSGVLTGWMVEDIEAAAMWLGSNGEFVAKLVELRLLDRTDGEYSVHNWNVHQPYVCNAKARSEHARVAANKRYENKRSVQAGCSEHAKPMINQERAEVGHALIEKAYPPVPVPVPVPVPPPLPALAVSVPENRTDRTDKTDKNGEEEKLKGDKSGGAFKIWIKEWDAAFEHAVYPVIESDMNLGMLGNAYRAAKGNEKEHIFRAAIRLFLKDSKIRHHTLSVFVGACYADFYARACREARTARSEERGVRSEPAASTPIISLDEVKAEMARTGKSATSCQRSLEEARYKASKAQA